jgi:hypothetical protein
VHILLHSKAHAVRGMSCGETKKSSHFPMRPVFRPLRQTLVIWTEERKSFRLHQIAYLCVSYVAVVV